MGLLDDAIREHLELKRRGGADPSEIALQERDALDPVDRSQDAAAEAPEDFQEPDLAFAPPAEAEADFAEPLREDAAAEGPAPMTAGQETAEIDMEAVLAETDEHDAPHGDPLGSEALADEPSEPIAGQERLSFE